MKQIPWKTYALWVLGAEAVGGLSGWLTREGARRYAETMVQPPLSPPAAVFPVVWGALFALMGVGGARIYLAPASVGRGRSLGLYFLQLAFNFGWTLLFFNLQNYGLALLWLLVLWGMILGMILAFREVDPPAAWLQVPYFLWVTFAAYLNLGAWVLNR